MNEDVKDELDSYQLKELYEAINEVDKNNTISWNDLKNEMNEWKKSITIHSSKTNQQ